MYLFVFTFTDTRCRCGSNKDGKTQKEDLELLVEEKRKCITSIFFPADVAEKQTNSDFRNLVDCTQKILFMGMVMLLI